MAIKPFIVTQEIIAKPNIPYVIQVTEVMVLMPFFRKTGCPGNYHYVDATGEFDLCLDETKTKYLFTNRLSTEEVFAYRFVSSFFPQSNFRG